MNMMMFPRMLSSHDEGWAWLMRAHPTVLGMFVLYVAPMSLIPAAMLLYAADSEGGRLMLGNISMHEAELLTVRFYIAELLMVPVMAVAIQFIGDMAAARPEYHDAFAFAAVVPTPLWLSSLALFVPSLAFNAVAAAGGLFLAGLLIYEGTCRVFKLADENQSLLLTGSILAAGLVAWASLMGLALLSWRAAIA